jgi:phospholipase/carboxylesterase
MAMLIDGPRQGPTRGGKPDSLVVFLHGYGSNGADLMSLAPYFARSLPGAQFVGPNAPEPVAMGVSGFQWFPISRLDPRETELGVRRSEPALQRFLDRELERYGLPPERLALVGFSQGTMMALHVGLRRERLGAIVGYSGMLAAGAALEAEAKCTPPILLVHGDRDEVIPVGALFAAGQVLAAAGQSCLWRVSYGLPHSIGPDGLEYGEHFLSKALS